MDQRVYILREEAIEIVSLCRLADRLNDVPWLLRSGKHAGAVKAELQSQPSQDAAAVRPADGVFDRGIAVQVGQRIDVAAMEQAARAAGRLT
jgi:hypothetical protein